MNSPLFKKPSRSIRDKLERQLLALAKERTDYLTQTDARMLAVQRQLEQRETRRIDWHDTDLGTDALDLIPVDAMASPSVYAETPAITPADDIPAERAARTMRLLVALLKLVATDQRSPRLTASASLLALGADCPSMRDVAKAEGVSPEWVSQRTEHIRQLFSLPPNHHNKDRHARAKYRALRLRCPVRRAKRSSHTQRPPGPHIASNAKETANVGISTNRKEIRRF